MDTNNEDIKYIAPKLMELKTWMNKTMDQEKVGNGYFNNLQDAIIDQIKLESRMMTRDVPQGYFEDLPKRVIPTKIKRFKPIYLLKYASVILTVGMAITAASYYLKQSIKSSDVEQLAIIEDASNGDVMRLLDDYVQDDSDFQMVINSGLLDTPTEESETTQIFDFLNVSEGEITTE